MERRAERHLQALLQFARDDPDVIAVLLFGSRARGEADAASDVDACLVLRPEAAQEAGRKRLDYLGRVDLDVVVYQALPLYVRQRVLRDGRVLLIKDQDLLYDIAIQTVRAWEDYRHLYRDFLERVARDRP
ncbi:MAG: nucleotidyltransferase domain-containing protein [Armatimonadota bacterium]|nr:nucleotidyltransferase domain-containing protein [Armatimonadota bacterium]MDR7449165.1 nucleotidyltransferase domain-containing protein [Armatimonadota bacterium]MDR7460628.1 nucleotidyltransferase domain-containing protein [Armatimonadota bacterium]MDR7480800.1 nucleotidyltransferase domain-containing protein [Armatimonadota bacterium]MDR7489782.1 nucleotidyltransferase domain-containing protein [Armatimonadota bacterium]